MTNMYTTYILFFNRSFYNKLFLIEIFYALKLSSKYCSFPILAASTMQLLSLVFQILCSTAAAKKNSVDRNEKSFCGWITQKNAFSMVANWDIKPKTI